MRRTIQFLPLAFITLTACGGGGGGGGGDPEAKTVGAQRVDFIEPFDGELEASADLGAQYDAANNVIIVRSARFPNTQTQLAEVTDSMMPPNFSAFNDGTSQARAVRGVTAGGTAYAVRWEDNGSGRGHERIGETELPVSGVGTFFGTYAGTLGTQGNHANLGTIRGNVGITADFDAGTLSGEIADRINQNGRLFNTLLLAETAITPEGGFSGQTFEGRSDFLGHGVSPGRYDGLIVDTDGGGIVGSVKVDHESSPSFANITETGAFVAQRN